MKRRFLLLGLVAVLAVVFSITGPAGAIVIPPQPEPDAPCCIDLVGQSCSWGQSAVYCNWGDYGPGYCQCGGVWYCSSYRSIPANPDRPICYYYY